VSILGSDLALQRERSWTFGDEWDQSASGLYVPPSIEVEEVVFPLAVDLFAGAGGFSCGFHMAGFHVIGALEWDFWASITYLTNLGSPDTELIFVTGEDKDRWDSEVAKARKKKQPNMETGRDNWGSGWISHGADEHAEDFPADRDEEIDTSRYCLEPCEVFVFGDAKKVTGADFLAWLGLEPDDLAAIMGGPPCQGFSRGGKRQVMDERNSLVFDFIRLVCEMRPKAFIMENVPGIASMVTEEGVPVVDALCRIAEDGGFGAYDSIKRALLNTEGVGALASKPKPIGPRPKATAKGNTKSKKSEDPKNDDGQGSLL